MKKLIVLVSVFVSSISFSQISYTMLNEVENLILDRYEINYTGAHVRFMVESQIVNQLDSITKSDMIVAYDKFQKWNSNYFKSIPDTNYFSDGIEYMSNKSSDDFLKISFNETRKIVGLYSKYVGDQQNDIQTIEILELYSTGITNYIDHIIMIQDYSNHWFVLTSLYDKVLIEYPDNLIP